MIADPYNTRLFQMMTNYQFGMYNQRYGDVNFRAGAEWASRLPTPQYSFARRDISWLTGQSANLRLSALASGNIGGPSINSYTPGLWHDVSTSFRISAAGAYDLRDSAYNDWSSGNRLTGAAKYVGSLGLRALSVPVWAGESAVSLVRNQSLYSTQADRQDAAVIGLAVSGLSAMGRSAALNVAESNVVAPLTRTEVRAKIFGTAQQTGSDGAHAFKSYREAILLARNPDVEAVFLNRGYNRGLDLAPNTISPNRRPDVLGRYFDGRVDRIEVFSKTDDPFFLESRNTFLDPQIIRQGYTPLKPRVVYPVRGQ